jgi:hypothetical protein
MLKLCTEMNFRSRKFDRLTLPPPHFLRGRKSSGVCPSRIALTRNDTLAEELLGGGDYELDEGVVKAWPVLENIFRC